MAEPLERAPRQKIWLLYEGKGNPIADHYAVCEGLPKRYKRKAWWRIVSTTDSLKVAKIEVRKLDEKRGRAFFELVSPMVYVLYHDE